MTHQCRLDARAFSFSRHTDELLMASRVTRLDLKALSRLQSPTSSSSAQISGACRQLGTARQFSRSHNFVRSTSSRHAMAPQSLKQSKFGGEGFRPESEEEYEALRGIEVGIYLEKNKGRGPHNGLLRFSKFNT